MPLQKHTLKSEELKTNQGVRQGCSLSPTLFNIYIDDIIKTWKKEVNPGIPLNRNDYLNVLLYADDVAIIQNNEEDLQRSVYKLYQLGNAYNLRISKKKTKVMAHRGKFPVRSKIVVEDQILEQVSHFEYLGCNVSWDVDRDIEKKVNKFQSICGTINRTLQNKTTKENWRSHLNRMGNGRMPASVHNYQPRGRRDVGRPRKRWH